MKKLTGAEKEDAREKKEMMYNKAKGKCYVCGKRLTFTEAELAHRFHRGYVSMYGREVMFHEFMMEITCSKCNQKILINPASQPIKASQLLHRIYDDLKEKERL